MTDASDEPVELEDDVADYNLDEGESLTLETIADLVLYTLDWSVASLLDRIGNSFDINPMFQRRDAWNVERKSLYIESLIVGLPVPQIVLAEDPAHKGRFIVLDGKQRLITIKQFAAPDERYPGFKLQKLEFAKEATGMNFSDMQSSLTASELAEGFLAQPIRTIVVRNWRDPAVLYQVFVRLNQGSVALSPQELRQALFPSEFTEWVNTRSADSELIHKARRANKADFRMRDAEMLLRYVAFQEDIEGYRGVLRQFLDDACKREGARWAERGRSHYDDIADRCEEAIRRTFEVFARDAFMRFERDTYNRRFNIAVFDTMTAVLGDPTLTAEEILENKQDIKAAFEELCTSDHIFADSLQSTTKSITATGERIKRFGERVAGLVGHPLNVVDRASTLLAR
ncbi:DUF262 domain-containing protein [Clavibacter michiganensis subsp. phaseoli]|uniref:DUF262 domain-containing protein n=1 Tax=Clavibacter phaseoli TaxID=1734031 RepID=A0A8I0SAS0_9MICO|nr:DUF262 domain-containing protein [Clavibacter phaseoli]MBF4631235.1 DUF262 domain-containing protein [Clavibacter phaseoli]